jgi:hypothetical protein
MRVSDQPFTEEIARLQLIERQRLRPGALSRLNFTEPESAEYHHIIISLAGSLCSESAPPAVASC